MINNYFSLTRFVRELNHDLSGCIFSEAFSQDKNKLILSFIKNNKETFLEFHSGAQLPYLQIRNSFRRAKKNTSSFFQNLSGAKLNEIQIAGFERILKFIFDDFSLFLVFRGKDSNALLLTNNDEVEVFKNVDDASIKIILSEISTIEFGASFIFINELAIHSSLKDFRNRYPFFGKKLIAEIQLRNEKLEIPFNKAVKQVLAEIDNYSLGLFFDEVSKKYSILPDSFLLTKDLRKDNLFDNCSDAVREFLLVQIQAQLFQSLYKQALKFLEKEVNYSTAKLDAIRKKIDEGSKEILYSEYANLLLINLDKVARGMDRIQIENIYHDENLETIILKEKLSPNENVNYYFSKAKSEKIFFTRAKLEIIQLSKRLELALNQQKQLTELSSLAELKKFMKVLPLKDDIQNNESPKINFKQFLIDGKYRLYVGKDSKNNDLLTTKFAKQNDFWFHARSVSGSHVVLRVENTKEVVPKPVLKKAAQIAAFYSKAKTAGTAPVSYTLKKFVVKRKGMEVGMVSMLREDTLLVKPEIPQGCEMIIEEN